MLLFIDTASEKKIVSLARDGKIIAEIYLEKKVGEADRLLLQIEKLLKKNKTAIKNLKGVIVVKGPGAGFTSLRIGIAVANTLAWSLKIPIKGVKLGETEKRVFSSPKFFKPIIPFYGKQFNVTIK